jgi:hypothetical protein
MRMYVYIYIYVIYMGQYVYGIYVVYIRVYIYIYFICKYTFVCVSLQCKKLKHFVRHTRNYCGASKFIPQFLAESLTMFRGNVGLDCGGL